ncbi:hypothetical protein R5W23_002781 [Gemmata sp. JC673]|uniref:DUF3352 domain-containing protein n=1 Tax=Gemmata algarum TaxID=2975278 RepID=A0ABU5F2Y5_9BACT|nr:hypothetical protein [Gemmata algarum]MDY3561503.1 hypothetical protein [Gemmata algarum]
MRLSRLGLAVTLCAALTGPVRAAEPDKLLPADADTVAYVNFKQILEADVIKKYALEQIKQALAGQDAKKILEEMGLDPMKDIEKVWVGMSGSGRDDTKALAVIHGKFDPEKLLKAAEAASKKDGDKFSVVKDGGNTLFKFQPENGNPAYGTVVNDSTVVVGTDKKIIATALKQNEDAKKAPIAAELTTLIKGLDEKASLFAVSQVKGKLDSIKLPADPIDLTGLAKALPKTNTMSLVLRVTADVNIEVTFGMKDEDAAEDMGAALAKAIKDVGGFVPALVAFEPKAKPLGEILKTITSDVKKNSVVVKGKVTGDTIGKMITPEG